MKIDNGHGVTPPDASPVRKNPTREEPGPPPTGDRVELSGPSPANVADVSRSEKIERLRTQIQQGTYHVAPEDVARSIVDDMLADKSD